MACLVPAYPSPKTLNEPLPTHERSKQQISEIRKNKDSIETSEGLKRKSLKLADDEQLDRALYAWFIQQRSTGTPISGPLLQEKAKRFSTQLNTEAADREFKASTGWLEKYKTRHGIRNLSIQGKKLSAAEETVEPFLQKLHKVIEEKNLIPEQIYNANETELLWKCLPQRTRFLSRKICSRIQKSKGSFDSAGLYKCYWNSQTKTCSYWEVCKAEMLQTC